MPTKTATILKNTNVTDEHMDFINQTSFPQLVDGVGIFLHMLLFDKLADF